jgi:succinyl-diaminopimelate desuccinylase
MKRSCEHLTDEEAHAYSAPFPGPEHEHRGHPSLLALPRNCERPEVLLCAHLDVITHPDIRFYNSRVEDGRIVGPGAGDMKGSLAILMELFREFNGRKPGIKLGFVITSDEETGGECGIGHLVNECGLRCDAALIPDGGSISEITVEEKGILHVNIHCHGRSAHAARPWKGDNPVERLVEGLARLRRRFDEWRQPDSGNGDEHWHPTCSVTVIGTENATVNRVPSNATATLDIRFPAPHTAASLLALVQEELGTGITCDVIISAEASHLSPDQLYVRTTEDILGQPPRLTRNSGGSDARFLAAHGIPVLMSRPIVGRLHADDEWIDIDSMVIFHRICQTYLERRFDL